MGSLFSSASDQVEDGDNSKREDVAETTESQMLNEDIIDAFKQGLKAGLDNKYLDLSWKFYKFEEGKMNRKIDDEKIIHVCEWLVKLSGKIKTLNLNGNEGITSKGAIMLFNAIKTSSLPITDINLGGCGIDDSCISTLGELLKENKIIEQIEIGNGITNKGIELLSQHLHGNTTLKELGLQWNKGIHDISISHLLEIIEFTQIEDIQIRRTSIKNANVLRVPLAYNVLKYGGDILDLNEMDMKDDDIMKICEGIKRYGCGKVKEIDIGNNKLSSKGATLLFDTLKECKSEISLIIASENAFDDQCMLSLGKLLRGNEFVEFVDLSNNKLTDKGIEALSKHISGNKKISGLDIQGNDGITDTSVSFIISMIKTSSISELQTRQLNISDESKEEIEELLELDVEERDIPAISNLNLSTEV